MSHDKTHELVQKAYADVARKQSSEAAGRAARLHRRGAAHASFFSQNASCLRSCFGPAAPSGA